MADALEVLEILNRLESRLIPMAEEAIIENSQNIANANRYQLSIGERYDGTKLPPYAPSSVRRGKEAGPIKLFDRGDFYAGISVIPEYPVVQIESDDWKNSMLQDDYGEKILGVSDANLDMLEDEIMDSFIEIAQREIDSL